MARLRIAPATPIDRLDKAGPDRVQGEPELSVDWSEGAAHRGRLRVRTLITARWMVLAGELALLAVAGLVFRLHAPLPLCLAAVAASGGLNLVTAAAMTGQRQFRDAQAAGQLALDLLQISVLIFLTGGTGNPFVLTLIAPVALAAATLPPRPVLLLGLLAAAASLTLAFVTFPSSDFAALAGIGFSHRLGAAIANIVGIALIGGYVRQAASESARMGLALDVTQAVLAREQRLSALGALAAAAAHELGTPLATISIVAKELAREAQTDSVRDDAELLITQANRCRDILRRLTDAPADASDEVHERLSLRQLVQEVIEPHLNIKDVRVEAIVTGARGVTAPDIRRLPEISHAFASFVENAVDFAASEVLVSARFDAQWLSVEVRDDGPGFAPDILANLGEPYVTSRPGGEGSRTGHIGMGLGFFISKTLLERTGALVTFQNGKPHGAVVTARWPRSRIEVAEV